LRKDDRRDRGGVGPGLANQAFGPPQTLAVLQGEIAAMKYRPALGKSGAAAGEAGELRKAERSRSGRRRRSDSGLTLMPKAGIGPAERVRVVPALTDTEQTDWGQWCSGWRRALLS